MGGKPLPGAGRKALKDLATALLLALFFFLSSSACALAQNQKIISGQCARLFPVIMPLDYSYCRAAAWLDALKKASLLLPHTVNARISQMRLNPSLGKMAICAKIYPVDVVTPDISLSQEIKVFLTSDNNGLTVEQALDDPAGLLIEAGFITELQELLAEIKASWPATLAQAREKMAYLEERHQVLSGFWQVIMPEDFHNNKIRYLSYNDLAAISALARSSMTIHLMLAQAALAANRPQGCINAADTALRLCGDRLVISESMPVFALWPFLAASARHERALAHLRLGHTALAEADFSAAVKLLENSGQRNNLLTRTLLERGELRRGQHNFTDMCEDFLSACAYGQCENLVHARRQGLCQPAAE